jgi:GntR family transcriptional regulator
MVIDKDDGLAGGGAGALPASGGMYSDQHLRVSDAEREGVCGQLAEHFAAGRLDQAEFDDRVGRAMSAKTRADLRGLFADLPEPLSETGAPAVPELPRGGGGTPGNGPRAPGSPIEFRLDPASGVPTYLQLVHQVEHALRLGYLTLGDQLPKVRDVVASLAINPNTVLKAYKELETKGLTAGRPGQGTFIQATLGQVALPELAGLHKSLLGWLTTADAAGLDEDGIVALFASALRDFYKRRSGTGERRGARSGEAEGVA